MMGKRTSVARRSFTCRNVLPIRKRWIKERNARKGVSASAQSVRNNMVDVKLYSERNVKWKESKDKTYLSSASLKEPSGKERGFRFGKKAQYTGAHVHFEWLSLVESQYQLACQCQ